MRKAGAHLYEQLLTILKIVTLVFKVELPKRHLVCGYMCVNMLDFSYKKLHEK